MRTDIKLLEDEEIDDLQCSGLNIIQKKSGFRFGVDAVLLSDFADIQKNDNVIDLGTGSGIIPLLMSAKTEASKITGLEIQAEMAEVAQRSVIMNNLEDRIKIVCGDIRKGTELFGKSSFDCVVSNPPYISKGGGLINSSDMKAISRHEILCTLEELVESTGNLLPPGGRFAFIHRPERLADIIFYLRKYSLEPKFMRFVHPSPYKRPNMLLIKGTKNGNPMLKVMEPLYVYDMSGKYSEEINMIYGRDTQ